MIEEAKLTCEPEKKLTGIENAINRVKPCSNAYDVLSAKINCNHKGLGLDKIQRVKERLVYPKHTAKEKAVAAIEEA